MQLRTTNTPDPQGFLPFIQAPIHNWQAHLGNIHRCYDVIEQLHELAGRSLASGSWDTTVRLWASRAAAN